MLLKPGVNVEDLVKESACSGKVKVSGVEDLVKESTLTCDPSSRSRGRPADDEVSMDPAFLLPLLMLSAFLFELSETNRFSQLSSSRFFSLFSGEPW